MQVKSPLFNAIFPWIFYYDIGSRLQEMMFPTFALRSSDIKHLRNGKPLDPIYLVS